MDNKTARFIRRVTKQVHLNLANGAEGKFVRMTSDDKAKLYARQMRKQGKTENELLSELRDAQRLNRIVFGK